MHTELMNVGNLHVALADRERTTKTRKEHLCLAEAYFKESIRIHTKNHGSAHPLTMEVESDLSDVELRLSRA
jgi:hypothetical protein